MVPELVETLRRYFEQEAVSYKIEAGFLYGSQASGFPRPDSDMDLAVVFEEEEASEEEIFSRLNAMAMRLIEVLGCEVNLIPVYKDFRRPMLYYNAIVKGIAVFMKDQRHHARLVNEAIYHMEDFETFGRGWQIVLTRRNLEQIKHA